MRENFKTMIRQEMTPAEIKKPEGLEFAFLQALTESEHRGLHWSHDE